jgi:transposase-like protein
MQALSYRGYRFPSAIIQYAVWLALRFTLSFRDVEDLLGERGIDVSHETAAGPDQSATKSCQPWRGAEPLTK